MDKLLYYRIKRLRDSNTNELKSVFSEEEKKSLKDIEMRHQAEVWRIQRECERMWESGNTYEALVLFEKLVALRNNKCSDSSVGGKT